MAGTGVRRSLEPLMYLAAAMLLHGLLFLIPYDPGKATDAGTTRGVRIRAIGEARQTPSSKPSPAQAPRESLPPVPPAAVSDLAHSSIGGGTPGQGAARTGGPAGSGGPRGEDGPSDRSGQGGGDAPAETEFGSYLARLRSEKVQGWARESAGRAKQGWKGSGKAGTAWGTGSGGGTGTGDGTGGKGTGKGGGGGGYLDPRVRMVVTSYPPTGVERRYTQVPYPDLKIKQHQIASGWWNVYIQIVTDKDGGVVRRLVLRPETEGPLEKIFVDQVQKEIDRWSFDRAEAEILVDVRFYVE